MSIAKEKICDRDTTDQIWQQKMMLIDRKNNRENSSTTANNSHLMYCLATMTNATSGQTFGPMESLFGNDVTLKVIDFLAIQRDSQTIADISKGILVETQEIDVAIKQLVNTNVIGIDESKSAETGIANNSMENTYYHIRTDSPSAVSVIHLYNYINCMEKHTRILYSSDASST